MMPAGRRAATHQARTEAKTPKLAWQCGFVLFNWPRLMTKSPALLACLLLAALACLSAAAEDAPPVIKALSDVLPGGPVGEMIYGMSDDTILWTNGVYFSSEGTVLTADSATVNVKTGDVKADGHVHIESGDQLWVGDHIDYNFKTKLIHTEEFRTGEAPVFAAGTQLSGNSNRIYTAQNAMITTDDISDPAYRVRASRVVIIPGKTVQMWNAVFYIGTMPVFYFPYYERNLGKRVNNLSFTPGYRSRYGPYLLSTYSWYLGDAADGKIHVDYRSYRGPGAGPDVNLHLGQWGEASFKYYYTHDQRPNNDTNGLPFYGNIPNNRQRFYLGWQATPATNLNLKALVNYQSDPLILHDYFPGEYIMNPQPNTFIEANKYWENWSLDGEATPRVNNFFSQIERLPDVKLTGFNQQILDTPVYYDSESSVGWYKAYVANATNGLYSEQNGYYTNNAARFDTFHQLTVPWTFFNWLNVTPNAGGRLTYYGEQDIGPGTTNQQISREVFNTGVNVSFKASQLWPDATNSWLQVDGLRHILEPSVDYVFVPTPGTDPNTTLPQFDSELPSLLLLPIDFPDYNDIDSIDRRNVLRFGLRNILQTKRDGELEDLVNWNVLLDWRLDPQPGAHRLDDLYSQLTLRPRSWVTLDSQVRYNINDGLLNLAFHQLTFTPNNRWSWGIGHWYVRGGAWGNGVWDENNFISSNFYFRLDDNWGLRLQHNFNAVDGRLQSQFYTIYRDFRSMTAAVTFHVENDLGSSTDYTVAFQLSLKASPLFAPGLDAVNPYSLVGE